MPLWCQLISPEKAGGTVTDDRYLTAAELAARLNLSKKTILRWVHAGKLKGTKFGRDWRFLDGDYWPDKRPEDDQ